MLRWLLILCIFLLVSCDQSQPSSGSITVSEALSETDLSGYIKAEGPHNFVFPKDYNSHPEYKNEWWYFTGNLATAEDRTFGFQVTFFRVGLSPKKYERSSSWATNQIWMAHAAITDIAGNQHVKMERFARGALGLAGNTHAPFRVWLDNWQLSSEQTGFPWSINISEQAFSIDLTVMPTKQVVLQGDKGLSQKSPEPGNASYYFTYPRLKTDGQLTVGSKKYTVSGLSWFDREWGTSLLADDQSGWDWFALQFDSGYDLMYYQLRDNSGQSHLSSLGSLVNKDGESVTIRPEDIRLKPVKWWTSPNGTKYPVQWEMYYLPGDQHWLVRAAIDSQLMDVSVQYWEGAVTIHHPKSNSIIGKGYLEMTGY